MRRRAGMCSGRMRDIEACGWRFAGRDGAVVAAGCCVFVVVSGGGGAVGRLSLFEADGGATYAGCFGRKKFRIEGCPLALEEGSDMMSCWATKKRQTGVQDGSEIYLLITPRSLSEDWYVPNTINTHIKHLRWMEQDAYVLREPRAPFYPDCLGR